MVKASDEDLAWLYPGTTPAQVARNWLDLGPALVVVTMGGQGAFALTRAGRLDVPAPKVAVADTVGAGDSFMSALLDGLAHAGLLGTGKRAALRTAEPEVLRGVLVRSAHAAAITVGRPGANPPTVAELAMTR